jgi:hypothetical protein
VYAALLKLRNHPLYKSAFLTNRVDQNLSAAFKWLRLTTDTSNVVVMGNFDVSPAPGSVTFPTAGTWYDYFTGETLTATGTAQNFMLQPGEYHVYVNRNINNTATGGNPPGGQTTLALAVLPNPATASGQVKIEVPASGRLAISITDITGRQCAYYDAGARTQGSYRFRIHEVAGNAGAWAAGIYFIRVDFNGQSVSSRMVIVN